MVVSERRRKRIAVVIPKFGLVGGAEQFALELTSRFAGNPDFDIHVFANKWAAADDRITFHKVPIIKFPRSLTTASFARFAAARIARAGGFDIVHTHDRLFNADLFTMHGVPHRFWVREVRRKRMSIFDRSTAFVEESLILGDNSCRFAVVSNLVRETLLNEYPRMDAGRISVICPGVDTNEFQANGNSAGIRRSLGVNESEILVLFVSMNFELKGLDLLMRALGRLKNPAPAKKYRLLVVGKGNLKKYTGMAAELGVDAIFTGAAGREKMAGFYQACNIFSMLSKFDTFGMAALEAMAASVPVIISDRVGARDLVTEGVNGCVVSYEAGPDEVAAKLLLVSDNLNSMSANALRTAQGCSWEKTAEKTQELFNSILETKSKK